MTSGWQAGGGREVAVLASPHDNKERARLEVLVAREVYGPDAADWQYLTGTFTYGSGAFNQGKLRLRPDRSGR